MAAIGVLIPFAVLTGTVGLEYLSTTFPAWVSMTWMLLTFLGGARIAVSLFSGNTWGMVMGSAMVSWMLLVYGIALLDSTGFDAGWVNTAVAIVLIVVSAMRSAHLRELSREIRRLEHG